MLRANEVLPIDGRAATTMSSCLRIPNIILSTSGNPVLNPKTSSFFGPDNFSRCSTVSFIYLENI